MENKKFNTLIKRAFSSTTSSEGLISRVTNIWLKYDLTTEQVSTLSEIKVDTMRDFATCPDRYLFKTD